MRHGSRRVPADWHMVVMRREARDALSDLLVREFAVQAGRAVLQTVDVEPSLADPVELPEAWGTEMLRD